jgi:hypothetical protein
MIPPLKVFDHTSGPSEQKDKTLDPPKENGTWTVAVFMDDRLLASSDFVIK